MQIADTTEAARHKAPIPNGPTATLLVTEESSDQVAVFQLELAPGSAMPEHDHGASEIVLIPAAGTLELSHNGETKKLTAGTTVAHVAIGDRVGLANPGTEPAKVTIVASPPEFARHLATWPSA